MMNAAMNVAFRLETAFARSYIMPTISEPLTEHLSWTYSRCRAAFIAGQIGPVTFLVSLQLLGLSPRDAEAEVNLAKMERKR